MAEDDKRRYWEGLNHELLAIIFTKIPIDELMRIAPFVCRGWREAVTRPDRWSEIDIMKWSRLAPHYDVVDDAVRNLVHLSRHNLRRLSVFRIGNLGFSITVFFGNHLRVLEIPMSEVNDSTLEESSGSLKALAILDISFCKNITSKGIEILGKNCTSLIHLRRNMFPHTHQAIYYNIVSTLINEDEALAIANTMLKLEHLELEFGCFSDRGLDVILNNCNALSYLNIRGCLYVKLDGNVGMRSHALKSFIEPFNDTYELHPLSNNEIHD